MKVARISIRNIMGIEELEIRPGSITTLEGRNGVGKTSALEAIRAVIEGGHDATLLKNGAERGEVVLVLEDETEIRKTITPTGSSLTVRKPEEGVISSPQTYINRLADSISANPIAFLQADEERQIEYILETASLSLDRDEVEKALAGAVEISGADLLGQPLDVIARLHKRVYDERTGVNREAKGKKATLEQMQGSVAKIADPTEQIQALEAERDQLPTQANAERARIREKAKERLASIEGPYLEQISELERRIEELRSDMATKTAGVRTKEQEYLAAVDAKERLRLTEIRGELDVLRVQATTLAQQENTRRIAQQMKAEVESLTARSQDLTSALARLDELKLGLMGKLPIKGLEIRDGKLFKDGVPFRRVNTADRMKVAIQLAQKRVGRVPLICVDGIECLDGPTFEAFRKNAAKTDLQFIVTRVSPDTGDGAPAGLQVETEGPAQEGAAA